MKITFGSQITLESGISATILDADVNAGVFVKADKVVPLCVGGHGKHAGEPLGNGDRFWVTLSPWRIAYDKDGVKCGIEL